MGQDSLFSAPRTDLTDEELTRVSLCGIQPLSQRALSIKTYQWHFWTGQPRRGGVTEPRAWPELLLLLKPTSSLTCISRCPSQSNPRCVGLASSPLQLPSFPSGDPPTPPATSPTPRGGATPPPCPDASTAAVPPRCPSPRPRRRPARRAAPAGSSPAAATGKRRAGPAGRVSSAL